MIMVSFKEFIIAEGTFVGQQLPGVLLDAKPLKTVKG